MEDVMTGAGVTQKCTSGTGTLRGGCLLELELMCWPLTRQWRPHSDDKGDREAVGTWRAGGRDAEE